MPNGDENQLIELAQYRIETKTRASAILALAGVALVLIFAVLPVFAGRGLIQDLIFVFYMLALAQCWNLLAGYAGLVSVGQQAFVGLGGYLLFALTIGAGIDPIAAVVLSGLIAAVFAVPTALVLFRLRGPYFAIGSWVWRPEHRCWSISCCDRATALRFSPSAIRKRPPKAQASIASAPSLGFMCWSRPRPG